jgi:hypothetical protein
MNSWAQGEGQPGLGYMLFFDRAKDETTQRQDPTATGVGGRGPLANNIGPERTEAVRAQLGLKAGDAAFFVAGDPAIFAKFAGLARNKVAQELKLVDENRFEFAWIVDFPMFEWNEDEKKIDFSHNPFSMPQGGLEALQDKDPLHIKAFQYDIACNGFELASGGIRNHTPEAMVKAFEIAGYGEQTVVERFGGMYRAFQYGAPPHGGMTMRSTPAAMPPCGGRRPHRHAARRRAEPARGGAVPDEPARRGSADGRAGDGDAEAIARVAHPDEPAGILALARSGAATRRFSPSAARRSRPPPERRSHGTGRGTTRRPVGLR